MESRDLQINFSAEIGTINADNFISIKEWVDEVTAPYKAAIVEEGKVRDAKDDLAHLRKAMAGLESERKRLKKLWNEPYAKWEAQYKEATQGIQDAIENLDVQVKAFTEAERQKSESEIRAAIASDAKDISARLARMLDENEELFKRICKEEYANKSFGRLKATLEWRQALAAMDTDLKAIGDNHQLLALYIEKGSLSNAQLALAELNRYEAPARQEDKADDMPALSADELKTVRMKRIYIGPRYKCLELLRYAEELGLEIEKEMNREEM